MSKSVPFLSLCLMFSVLSLISGARASSADSINLCDNAQLDAKAKVRLVEVVNLLKRKPDLDAKASSTGVGNCEASALYKDSLPPGSMLPHYISPPSCGAIVTVTSADDRRAEAAYLYRTLNKNSNVPVCVFINQAVHL